MKESLITRSVCECELRLKEKHTLIYLVLGFLHDQLAIHVDNLTGKEGSSNIRVRNSVPFL